MNISFILFSLHLISIYNIKPLLIEMDELKKIDDSEVNMKRKLLYGVILSHTICDI